MFKKCGLVLIAAVVFAQPVFAFDFAGSDDKACATIVKACLDGGYKRSENDDKRFWQDCMKPILLDKTVANVSVDAKDVKACRAAKIKKLSKQLDELKKVDSK